jgi:two-component system, OmpR family, sensor kinase
MRKRRLRIVLALLFAALTAVLSVTPLMLWRTARAEAINRSLDDDLVAQMEEVLHGELIGKPPDNFPAWFVSVNDGSVKPFAETDLEPPLNGWIRDAGESPSFRSYSQDDNDKYRAYIRPKTAGQGYVTLLSTGDRDRKLDDLRTRALALAAGLVVACLLLGYVVSGLALAPVRKMMADQQGFLADAAHEMRTPLAVILASSSQAMSRPRSSEEYVRSLAEIRSAAERASTGVNEMLDLVRFESGQTLPRVAPLRLDLLAEEVAASVRSDDAEITADPSSPVVVDADMALLRQAVENVVRNAARRAGNVELTTRIDRTDGIIEVTDDGPGFDPAVIERVFERYQRGDRRGEAGMGLAIVKAIATAHGGSVSAANRPEGGAVVSLRVPLSRSVAS